MSRPGAFWPLTQVLLHRDARWRGPHLWRLAFLVILWFSLWGAAESAPGRIAAGRDLLSAVAFTTILVCMAEAVRGFTSLLADQWTGNNLDLLKLTGLNPLELLVARGIPECLSATMLLLLQIPLMLLSVTLGGVTLLQVAGVLFQQVLVFVTSVALTLAVASTRVRPSQASARAVLLIFGYHLVTMVLDALYSASGGPYTSSMLEATRILSSGFRGPILHWRLLVHFVIVAAAFWQASRVFHGFWLNQEATRTDDVPQGDAPLDAPVPWRPSVKPLRCQSDPLFWKDYHYLVGGDELWNGKWLLLAIVSPFILLILLPGLQCVLILWLLFGFGCLTGLSHLSARLWGTEIKERTLWGLALLPDAPRDVVLAKLRVMAVMSTPEVALFLVLMVMSVVSNQIWEALILVVVSFSFAMVACTDAAWRLLPSTWEAFTARIKLVALPSSVWIAAGALAFWSPAIGIFTLMCGTPLVCSLAIQEACHWLAEQAGSEIGGT